MSLPPSASVPPASSLLPKDSARWFDEEVHPHESDLRVFLQGSYPRARDLDDVVQETYARVWTLKERAAAPIRSARAVLFTIARRVVIDQLRRLKRSPFDPAVDPHSVPIADTLLPANEELLRREKVQLLIAVLAQLPPRCREIVVLQKLQGHTRAEVAQQLGLSEKTVDCQLCKGMRRLQGLLRQRGLTEAFLE